MQTVQVKSDKGGGWVPMSHQWQFPGFDHVFRLCKILSLGEATHEVHRELYDSVQLLVQRKLVQNKKLLLKSKAVQILT